MTREQRTALVRRYANGPAVFEAAVKLVPNAALQWRPAPGKWTVHEVIVHCADSEVNAHMRLRYLAAEPNPLVMGYDQDRWAIDLAYHEHPLEPALATIRAARENTVPLLERLTEAQWTRTGRHTEHPGAYGVERWLEIYAEHLEVHARQVGRNVEAWKRREG
jgi:hypothetical protein